MYTHYTQYQCVWEREADQQPVNTVSSIGHRHKASGEDWDLTGYVISWSMEIGTDSHSHLRYGAHSKTYQ